MRKSEIQTEWDLGADPRYKRQNMERAMRGKIERGLVELITNSDDSYRDLEEQEKHVSGKIRIEIERRRKGSTLVIVRDRAWGMSREEMFDKLGTLGRRTSGFEKGKPRRGLHGRGARDVVAFGLVRFESIKDEKYNRLIISPSLKCRFTEPHAIAATQAIRRQLGIPKGNGTVVTIEVESRFRVPSHEKLLKDFSRYYSLRDILSNPRREVTIVDRNKRREDRLSYKYPQGEIIFNKNIAIPNYPAVEARLVIRRHETPFEQDFLPYREGILVKSAGAIHDCTYFGLESEPLSWKFTGEIDCEFIDTLIREYDDRDETNPDEPGHPEDNPTRLLDPFRDGLILEHPFARALYERGREILERFVEDMKDKELPQKRNVSDEGLDKKLADLSEKISKIFEKRVKELEEEIPPGTIDKDKIKELGIGLHILPPEEMPIVVNQPKTFSIIVKHFEVLDDSSPINIKSSDAAVKVRSSPVYFKKIWEDGRTGATTFTVEGSCIGAEAYVEAHYDGYNNSVHVRVVEPPPPRELPEGLSFDKASYRVLINREKALTLWLKTHSVMEYPILAELSSDHAEIVIKGGGRTELRKTGVSDVFIGKVGILGRQLKARGTVTARIKDLSAETHVTVEECSPTSGVKLKFEPVEEDFGSVRYKWDRKDPYLLKIGAKHPSIRRYLGIPNESGYPDLNPPLYHAVLAEVIAEALAFRLLEKQFKREGEDGRLDYSTTDAYYHKQFSEFLSVTHDILSSQVLKVL